MTTGSTSTWTAATTRVLAQITTSLHWLHLNWQRSEKKLWRKPRGKRSRNYGKRRRGRGRGRGKKSESGNERKKRIELR